MKRSTKFSRPPLRHWVFMMPLLASFAMWLPAIHVPFWQDDYFYILNAHVSSLAGESFWASLWPNQGYQSWNWRPLSQDMYWRLVEGSLNADSRLAHLLNIVLLYSAAISFGFFSYIYARLARWNDPVWIAILAAGLYAVADFNFLPVYWVSAANSSILTILIFVVLSLLFVFEQLASAYRRFALATCVIVLSMMSLLVKESAILLPALWVLAKVSNGTPWKYRREQLAILAVFAIGTALWWTVRSSFVLPTPPEYGLQFSFNIVRNFVAQIAWLLNIPRESIRLLAIGQIGLGILWILLTLIPVLAAIFYIKKPLAHSLNRRQIVSAFLFAGASYAPYYFLSWNSYEYYVAVSVGLLLLLLSKGIMASSQPLVPVLLVLASSFFGVMGNRLAGYPSFIARASWAESTLVALEKLDFKLPLLVSVADQHRFSAIGAEGLAWRLNIPREQIIFTNECLNEASQILIEDGEGRVFIENCQTKSKTLILQP